VTLKYKKKMKKEKVALKMLSHIIEKSYQNLVIKKSFSFYL